MGNLSDALMLKEFNRHEYMVEPRFMTFNLQRQITGLIIDKVHATGT